MFALIEQPTHGWGSPLVWVPLLAGVVCFVLFILWEARAKHPMLDLGLFRIRNFSVANLTTLSAYAGLMGGLFFLGLFLQQVVGYTPVEAGLATTPISLILFVLSPRFGRITSGTGPRLPMTVGPLVAGAGMLLMLRIGADASYLGDVLPAILVFGLGLSAIVAPLTATVLDSVPENRAGVASGVNNGVSRVAGLLAIAVLGAVISAQFGSSLDDALGARQLSPQAVAAVEEAKSKPLAAPRTGDLAAAEAATVEGAAADASTSGFHLGVGIAGVLMICGGIVAGVGIRNPERRSEAFPNRGTASAGECGHSAECDTAIPDPETAIPEPA